VIGAVRDCPEKAGELADTVSEIESVKHAYESGAKACAGVDF